VENRPVRIHTAEGVIDGCLHITPRLRTLDDLNLVARRFITLHTPKSLTSGWEVGAGALGVNKNSTLFVYELSPPPLISGQHFGKFTRASVRLRVARFEVEGFVHVPPGGSAMKRLDHGEHPFVSLTSVFLTGPDTQSTHPFLAVNRQFITTAQAVEAHEMPAAASLAESEFESER